MLSERRLLCPTTAAITATCPSHEATIGHSTCLARVQRVANTDTRIIRRNGRALDPTTKMAAR